MSVRLMPVSSANVAGTNGVNQKVIAFRPNTNEIWTVVCDWEAVGSVHRGFYKCTNGVDFELVTDWQPELSWGLAGVYVPSVSFVFSDNGLYLHAVTICKVHIGSNIYSRIIYGRLTISTNTWYYLNTTTLAWSTTPNYYYSETYSSSSFYCPDLVMDNRTTPLPIIIAGNNISGASGSLIYMYFGVTGFNSEIILGYDRAYYPTLRELGTGLYKSVFIHTSSATSSYLYAISLTYGSAPPAVNWDNPSCTPGTFQASIYVMIGSIGFLWRNSSGDLNFRIWDGLSLSAIETVESLLTVYSWALTYRNGQWKAIYSADDLLYYRFRSIAGEWEFGSEQPGLDPALYRGLGQIWQGSNPSLIHQANFGVLVHNILTGIPFNIPYTFVYYYFEPPSTTGNYWDKGDLMGCQIYGIDVESQAIVSSTSSFQEYQIMDVLSILGETIFSDRSGFYYFWNEYYDQTDVLTTLGRELVFSTGEKDAGNKTYKLLDFIVLTYDIDSRSWLDVLIVSDDGSQVTFVGDPNSGGLGLTARQNGIPQGVHLNGHSFRVFVREHSEYHAALRGIELQGIYHGMLV